MSSTNVVDFSVRQNKTIERLIVFDNLQNLIEGLDLTKLVYVGFGSVWFTDFHLAHRQLGITTMRSIEMDPIVYRRANFNKPYRTLKVIEGNSTVAIPSLIANRLLRTKPWIVWLDYDKCIDEARTSEISYLIRYLPPDSTLLITCSARLDRYGELEDRLERLEELFGDSVPSGLSNESIRDNQGFMNVLRKCLENYMISSAIRISRTGGFVPAFSIAYRDTTPMVTVGGFLPSARLESAARTLIAAPDWSGRVEDPIITPPLTPREVSTLQAQLPRDSELSRSRLRQLGFDLEDSQLKAYVDHYLKYPTFAQVAL